MSAKNANGDEEAALVEEPAERIGRYLAEHGVDYEIIEHAETMTAASEAREAGVPATDTAKAILLAEADEYLLAAIPASHRLDLGKVSSLTGRTDLRLATEAEMSVLAPNLELGALPVLGPDLPAAEILDRRLLEHERIVCSAGDHRHAVRFPPGALVDLVEPVVADICQD